MDPREIEMIRNKNFGCGDSQFITIVFLYLWYKNTGANFYFFHVHRGFCYRLPLLYSSTQCLVTSLSPDPPGVFQAFEWLNQNSEPWHLFCDFWKGVNWVTWYENRRIRGWDFCDCFSVQYKIDRVIKTHCGLKRKTEAKYWIHLQISSWFTNHFTLLCLNYWSQLLDFSFHELKRFLWCQNLWKGVSWKN